MPSHGKGPHPARHDRASIRGRWYELLSAAARGGDRAGRCRRPVRSPMRWCGSSGRTFCRSCPICARSSRSAPASTTSSPIPALPDVPIVRVVADNLTQHMTEYVRLAGARPSPPGHALPRAAEARRSGTSRRSGRRATSRSASWGSASSAAPPRRRCSSLGFQVNGWSRTRAVDGGRRDLPRRQAG